MIKNIKIEDVSHINNIKKFASGKSNNSSTAKKMTRVLNLFKKYKINYEELLPKYKKHQVSFILDNSNTQLANAIRRVLTDEIPIDSMTFDFKDHLIGTDTKPKSDEYILTDVIIQKIEAIPLKQDIPNKDKIRMTLDITNNTLGVIPVYSSDIKVFSGSKTNEIKNHDFFEGCHIITYLRPNRRIYIKNIYITNGIGIDNGNAFKATNTVEYEIINNSFKSLQYNANKFKIGYMTYGNIKPKKIMVKCCDVLLNKCQKAKENIEKALNSESFKKSKLKYYYSNELEIETVKNVVKYIFTNEYWTLANLISWYCYELDPNIPFTAPGLLHPNIEKARVMIKHKQPHKLIIDAIKKAISDIKKIKKNFD